MLPLVLITNVSFLMCDRPPIELDRSYMSTRCTRLGLQAGMIRNDLRRDDGLGYLLKLSTSP